MENEKKIKIIKIEDIEREGVRAVALTLNTGERVVFVNTTPHQITFKTPDSGMEFTVPESGVIVNATPAEEEVSSSAGIKFVKTTFVASSSEATKVDRIYRLFRDEATMILPIGSIIAAQAFPGRVFAMTPCPGFERVEPSKKRMNPFKFITYTF